MSNSISFTGHLGRDSEIKSVGDTTVLEFSVGNNVGFGDKKTTNWFKCTIWGKRGSSIAQYLKKGSQVFVCGEFTQRTYTNKDGIEKTSLEVRVDNVDFIGGKKSDDQASVQQTNNTQEPDMPF